MASSTVKTLTITTTPQLVSPAHVYRRALSIVNESSANEVYVGRQNGNVTGDRQPVAVNKGSWSDNKTQTEYWAWTTSGTATVTIVEGFDK